MRFIKEIRLVFIVVLFRITFIYGQPPKCDHTPAKATVLVPSDQEHPFRLTIDTKQSDNEFLPDQTYVVTLATNNVTRSFKWFLITAEDPDVDNTLNQEDLTNVDVGTLKPLGRKSRYSEKCSKTVEETDNSDKIQVDVHWISPKQSDRPSVRLRAMVAENDEVWYTGSNLTLIIIKNDKRPVDSSPYDARETCTLCSEARYEVIFNGQWSRLTHPQHYPKEPDKNGFSDMIGASHDYNFILWKPNTGASAGLKLLAENGDISEMQRDIIRNVSVESGARTLIKGKGHMHPHMATPSYALFRVDRFHHLFSLVVSLIPSPDWFLGVSHFELCTNNEWLAGHDIPLYPWDAGTANGISYESETSVTQPVDTIHRVQVGSFDAASPFYQMNLNDLKPFAILKIRRLDVYPITDGCSNEKEESSANEDESQSDMDSDGNSDREEPKLAESRIYSDGCENAEWSGWSPCEPIYGSCGQGSQTRTRLAPINRNIRILVDSSDTMKMAEEHCNDIETEACFINCDDNF